MAQINDSQPAHPVITFQVNLETLNRQGHLVPNRTVASGNETTAEADNFRESRTIYLPGVTAAENRVNLSHGDTFTLKGQKALYFKNLYVSNPASPSDLLVIVSEE